MDEEGDPPLDISEFECVSMLPSRIVVVFTQTNRHYTYVWDAEDRGLSEPEIEGPCGVHPAEVLDCLARAVAYKSARQAFSEAAAERSVPRRSRKLQLRDFIMTRGGPERRPREPRH